MTTPQVCKVWLKIERIKTSRTKMYTHRNERITWMDVLIHMEELLLRWIGNVFLFSGGGGVDVMRDK